MKISRFFVASVAGAFAICGAASAAVIGGAVTGGGGGGSFIELTAPFGGVSSPANTVGNNTIQDPNLYAFDEGVFNVVADLALDFGGLSAGQKIESHFVFFDPKGGTDMEGYVDFDSDIIGVAALTALVNATDIYGNPAITYLTPGLRGLENNDIFGVNGNRLTIDWRASTPGDFIRVFTVSEVPLPAAAWVFLAGLGGLAARLRRKKQAV